MSDLYKTPTLSKKASGTLTKSLNPHQPLDYYHHNANDRYGFKTRK